ncbi:MAG: RNA 2',3'-cyclic phosphodiesterase [Verrucomicrobiia bacterium]
MIRAFIAIDIPEDVRAAITEAQARLKRANLSVKVSWTKIDNVHLTLQFLGYAEEPVVPKISEALAVVAGQHEPFNLRVKGVGAFPSEKRPRVLWVGCADAEGKLKTLARAVQEAMQQFGFEPEHREFSAHLTLGRIKPAPMKSGIPKPDDALTRALDSIKDTKFGTMHVDAIHLFQSQLHPEGSIYTKLSSHTFTGGHHAVET